MNVLVIGDIVGKPGMQYVAHTLPKLRKDWNIDFCMANGENLAGGSGLSEQACLQLRRNGVDVITSGDHVWDQRDFLSHIQSLPFILRPANLPSEQPGKGFCIFQHPSGLRIGVINLLGQIFMKLTADNPFRIAKDLVSAFRNQGIVHIFVDFHAEATSEKKAMGYFLDGRVTAVIGTHTHVPTADEQILPQGTAYITDVGMVGAKHSILGRSIPAVIQRFVTGIPSQFTVEKEPIEMNMVKIVVDDTTGYAIKIERRCYPIKEESKNELG